jgi:hypothetical protein
MNRRQFLAGLGAGLATIAITTRLATTELLPKNITARWDLERDTATIEISGTDQYGNRIEETIRVSSEQVENGGEIRMKRFKMIDTVVAGA